MPPRTVLFHVQSLVGLGHLRRAAALCRAMDRAGLAVTLAYGGPALADLIRRGLVDPGDAAVLQLPPIIGDPRTFAPRAADGGPVTHAIRTERTRLLLETYEAVQPDIVLTELFPFGRRAFRFELLPLLERATTEPGQRPVVLSSVRDILIPSTDPEKTKRMMAWFDRYFDGAIVHGDADLITLPDSFPAVSAHADRLAYGGYIDAGDGGSDRTERVPGRVVVSMGGGAAADALAAVLAPTIAATRGTGATWHVLVGPNTSTELANALRALAGSGVVVEDARPDFQSVLRGAAVSVSQAGYNTVVDLLVTGTPGVLIPFEGGGGETEQPMRAKLLARRGRFEVVAEPALTAEALGAAIRRATGAVAGFPSHPCDGADRAADLLTAWRPRERAQRREPVEATP